MLKGCFVHGFRQNARTRRYVCKDCYKQEANFVVILLGAVDQSDRASQTPPSSRRHSVISIAAIGMAGFGILGFPALPRTKCCIDHEHNLGLGRAIVLLPCSFKTRGEL